MVLDGLKSNAYITGCGYAIPGVNELSTKGMLVDTQIIMDKLIEGGIHNPTNMKPVSSDFALRNLGTTTLSIADIEDFEAGFGYRKEGVESVTEWELVEIAIKQAFKDSGIAAADVDSVMHVSGSLRQQREAGMDMGLHHCMKVYPKIFPDMRRDCLLQHQDSGCSGVIPPFRMAKSMLASGDYKNILVVCSNTGSGLRKNVTHAAAKNDLSEWINYVLFSDGACAFVLTAARAPEVILSRTRHQICYELLKVDSTTEVDFPIMESEVEIVTTEGSSAIVTRLHLNPDAAKKVFTIKLQEWLDKQKLSSDDLEALVLHQPNASVIAQVQKLIGEEKVLNIAGKYGNLIAASLGTQFCEQLTHMPLKDKGLIAGFTLGAHAGTTYGGFIARIHKEKVFTPAASSIASSDSTIA